MCGLQDGAFRQSMWEPLPVWVVVATPEKERTNDLERGSGDRIDRIWCFTPKQEN